MDQALSRAKGILMRTIGWHRTSRTSTDAPGSDDRLGRRRSLSARTLTIAVVASAASLSLPIAAGAGLHRHDHGFLAHLSTVTVGPSTIPSNGDVNPYGVAVVRHDDGALHAGDTLVSNFNDGGNAQGTGTTIVEVSPNGHQHLFAKLSSESLPSACPGGIGLTTALSILQGGWVVVGSLPTTDGTAATAGAGCLIVLDSRGVAREVWSGANINGPWDMTSSGTGRFAQLFVTNVLNGTVAADGGNPSVSPGNMVYEGTVVRFDVVLHPHRLPELVSQTVIAGGFAERTDPAALVLGPTGVALGADGTLFVADTLGDRIAAIPHAPWRSSTDGHPGGITVTSGGLLNAPLGMVVAPNGDILTVNGGDGNIVETTLRGTQLAPIQLDGSGSPPGAGALFGLAITPSGRGVLFVDDATNTLDLLH
jgi:hypothetical protein